MNAGQRLLVLSSLPSGTAAQLLTNPAVGSGGVVMNDGFEVLVLTNPINVELLEMQVEVQLDALPVLVELNDTGTMVLLSTTSIEIEVTE